jgi:hypothetical protein
MSSHNTHDYYFYYPLTLWHQRQLWSEQHFHFLMSPERILNTRHEGQVYRFLMPADTHVPHVTHVTHDHHS